jgi:asparagine synthase (glutamine-hydrolysing)
MGAWALGRAGVGPRRSDAVVHADPGAYYLDVNSRIGEQEAAHLAPGAPPPPEDFGLYRFERFRGMRDLAGFSRYAEFYGQLQRGLKKVDMASMRCSLEVRVPLLDREVIDLSLRIDPFDCLRNGTRKAPLRELLGRAVPPESIPKDKRGFAVPMGDWLRGPLRPLAEETLLDGELYPAGFFDRAAVERYWRSHLSGEADRKWGVWTLMALQWWARGPGSAVRGSHRAADADAGRVAAR